MNNDDINSISLKARFRINLIENKSNFEKEKNIFEKEYFQKYSQKLNEKKHFNFFQKINNISKNLLKKNFSQILNDEKLTAMKVHSILSKFNYNSKKLNLNNSQIFFSLQKFNKNNEKNINKKVKLNNDKKYNFSMDNYNKYKYNILKSISPINFIKIKKLEKKPKKSNKNLDDNICKSQSSIFNSGFEITKRGMKLKDSIWRSKNMNNIIHYKPFNLLNKITNGEKIGKIEIECKNN